MKVTDPVCGMTLPVEKAVAKAEYQDQAYYFCSEACRKQFYAEPERYARGEGGA